MSVKVAATPDVPAIVAHTVTISGLTPDLAAQLQAMINAVEWESGGGEFETLASELYEALSNFAEGDPKVYMDSTYQQGCPVMTPLTFTKPAEKPKAKKSRA